MSRIGKVFETLRNNWKKTIFFSGLAIWGSNYGHGKYLEFNLMRAYCQEALRYGNEKISALGNARHVTVVLNPVANKRKGKDDYDKYCAPLFHLAGLKVSLVVIEEEGQTKDLMEIMNNTDCVVLAGGDGTVHEAITGLFRRKDSTDAAKQFPIGILPIGKNNSIAHKLNSRIYDCQKDTKAKILAESSMAVIRQTLNKVDVMKIEGERGRPVYSLGFLNMGQLQNVTRKVDEYWYLGQRMKPYLAFFFQSFKDLRSEWDDQQDISIEYTKPCSGCSRCYHMFDADQKSKDETVQKPAQQRWWHSFVPKPKTVPIMDPKVIAHKKMIETMKNTINEECDQWETLTTKTKNVMVNDTLDNSIDIIIHPENLSRSEFIKEGVRMFRMEKLRTPATIQAKDCRIRTKFSLQEASEPVKDSMVTEIKEHRPNAIKELDNEDGENQNENGSAEADVQHGKESDHEHNENIRWISVDNEYYEIQSNIEISLMPRSVQIYHG